MAALTNFLKLLKPEKNDYVDVDKHISENYDKIDSKMQELNTSNSGKLDKGAVSTEYDTAKKIEDKIKAAQGTADNKLNKGSLPATVPDGKAIYDLLENNGGINIDPNLLYLNDVGTKTAGKLYLDRNKKGLFECVQTTTATTNSTTYFVDISNKASADRLANLIAYDYLYENYTGTNNFNLKKPIDNNKYWLYIIEFGSNHYPDITKTTVLEKINIGDNILAYNIDGNVLTSEVFSIKFTSNTTFQILKGEKRSDMLTKIIAFKKY